MVDYTVLVRSKSVETIDKVSQMTDKLVAAGVVLSSQNGSGTSPRYLFTQLNCIKPSMMSEATKAAYEVAKQFASDSGSHISSIRKASQGLFSITDRDTLNSPDSGETYDSMFGQSDLNKKVRVVVSIDYLLK